MRKKTDLTPRFLGGKFYAIGVLQQHSVASEVPARFAKSPVPAVHLSGNDLLGANIRSAGDFLQSSNCRFKVGSSVHFYEVEYGTEDPRYTHIYTGTPLLQEQKMNNLSDGSAGINEPNTVNIKNILPQYEMNRESDKAIQKMQSERISNLEKLIDGKEQEFSKERQERQLKIDELNEKIVELNIEKNTLRAEIQVLSARLEENTKYLERLIPDGEEEDVEPKRGGLADKIAGMDAVLGDGGTMVLLGKLAEGAGTGIGKLIEFCVDKFSDNKEPDKKESENKEEVKLEELPLDSSISSVNTGV